MVEKRGADRSCLKCGIVFHCAPSTLARGGGRGKFCSRTCQFLGKSEHRNCQVCGKTFRRCISRLNTGRSRFCSEVCRSKGHSVLNRGPANPNWRGGNTKERNRAANLRFFYKLTPEDFDRKLAEQKGVCAICGNPQKDKRGHPLHIDHNHTTGQVRGLLCHRCNRSVSVLESALFERTVSYLKNWADMAALKAETGTP